MVSSSPSTWVLVHQSTESVFAKITNNLFVVKSNEHSFHSPHPAWLPRGHTFLVFLQSHRPLFSLLPLSSLPSLLNAGFLQDSVLCFLLFLVYTLLLYHVKADNCQSYTFNLDLNPNLQSVYSRHDYVSLLECSTDTWSDFMPTIKHTSFPQKVCSSPVSANSVRGSTVRLFAFATTPGRLPGKKQQL